MLDLNVTMKEKIFGVIVTFLLLGTLLIKPGDGATDTFVPPTLPNGGLCFCPGDVETYTCTVVGGGVTVWSGTAFVCTPSNAIQLAHALYSGGTAAAACTNGAIIGNGISVDTSGAEPRYTSELSVTVSASMDGQTVVCSRDNTIIGNDSLRVAGPPPPPTNVMVTAVGVSSFTVTWTELTNNCGTSFSYDVVSECGGSCLVSTSTSGICSGWTARQNLICSVMVRAALCTGQSGSFSTPVMLNLTEPSPPPASDISGLAVYSDDSLDSITVTFRTDSVSPVEVAPGLSPAVIYSVQTIGDPQVVLTGNCNATLCQYLRNFTSDNRPSNDLTVSVIVSNGIGNGQSVNLNPEVPVPVTRVADVNVVVTGTIATLSVALSNSFQGSTNLLVNYGVMPNCDSNTMMSAMSRGAGDLLNVTLTSIMPETTYCYSAFVDHGQLTLQIKGVFSSECDVADLQAPVSPDTSEMCLMNGFAGGISIGNGSVCYNGTDPQDSTQPICNPGFQVSSTSSSSRVCQSDGNWNGTAAQCVAVEVISKPDSSSLIIAVSISAAVFFFGIGIIVGILLTLFCGICVQGIQQRNCGTLLLVILLIIVFGLGIGILVGYCCVKNKKEKDDKKHLESQEINPPPADSLYADPNTIEHEAAPGTEDQYAMVDRKVKKNTKPKPTPPEALYQDPNTIEHKTAASGDTYAVVDKPKRSSKKKGGPDVVPPASEGLTYADIDLSSKRPKPGSGRQAPQQPGEYPKEHPVEYSSVDHGNTSQL